MFYLFDYWVILLLFVPYCGLVSIPPPFATYQTKPRLFCLDDEGWQWARAGPRALLNRPWRVSYNILLFVLTARKRPSVTSPPRRSSNWRRSLKQTGRRRLTRTRGSEPVSHTSRMRNTSEYIYGLFILWITVTILSLLGGSNVGIDEVKGY